MTWPCNGSHRARSTVGAAAASAWTAHDVQEQVARIITETGVRAASDEQRELIAITTRLAADDCLSSLPPDAPHPEHVTHLTTLHVVAVETGLRDKLATRAAQSAGDATPRVDAPGLDPDQARAAAAVASTLPPVVVEGAAGAGKTTMLGAAIEAASAEGRSVRVVTPTKKAADVAAAELGVSAESVAKLVHEHGWRGNRDGVWTRLAPGDTDPENGSTYTGPSEAAQLIRDERVRGGLVDEAQTTMGSDGLSIGTGDLIQTRQNDSDVQVANRQTWTVQSVGSDRALWVKENGNGRKRQRTVRLPAEYVAEHTHLAYASTANGVHGATVPASHTILSDTLDASDVYVGMTRGQETNRLHVVAADLDDAREQFAAALERDRADRGPVAATQATREVVAGLAADGPVRLVNAERARLAEQIEPAERQAEKWEQVLTMLDRQGAAHRAESDQQEEVVVAADARAVQARAEVAAPLIEQASIDGTAYIATRERMWEARAARASAGRLRKRAASRAATEAAGEYRATEDAVRRRWGSLPIGAVGLEPWAETVASKRADADPRVTKTRQVVEQAHSDRQ